MNRVILPILGANMTHGTVRAWFKQEGDSVQAGEPLFEVETDKVNAEVEAESAGILRKIVAPPGARVPVLGVVAFVGGAEEPLPSLEAAETPAAMAGCDAPHEAERGTETPQATGGRAKASPAARRLARELGVSLDGLSGTGPRGEITRGDVQARAGPIAVSGERGRLEDAFLAQLRKDSAAFRALSSELKLELYRRHGAEIGERARIEPGAIVVAAEIRIGSGSVIGADSTIECDSVQLGKLSVFGKRTRVHCRSVEIGDALWAKDDVVIGGGGSSEPAARLKIGDAAFIGEAAYLNPCHPITLGDEVCIGSRAMLFTHSHWQSILQGYASLFGPIEIGDHVFIGNQAFVFPGVTIGTGATVMVNSFVAVNVAPRALVGGVPARVIRHVPLPSREEQAELFRARIGELGAALAERGYAIRESALPAGALLDLGDGRAVCFAPAWPLREGMAYRRLVLLTFCEEENLQPPSGCTVFDLGGARVVGVQDVLSDEVREFCRRRGIRFRPFAWRYGVGHFEGDRFVPRNPAR